MAISVKYFASLRERMGRAGEDIAADAVTTVAAVWKQVGDDPCLPASILIAVNKEYAGRDTPVKDGDEVAFFPPVTGG